MKNYELLEGMYYYELEAREKLFVRLQLNFAAYVIAITAIVYMSKTFDYSSSINTRIIFCILLLISLGLIGKSIWHTWQALTNWEYRLLPPAVESVAYSRSAIDYYKSLLNNNKLDYKKKEILLVGNKPYDIINGYILDSLSEAADFNSEINERRKRLNKVALKYLFFAAFPLGMAASQFVVMDLDTSSPRKNIAIEDSLLRESMVNIGERIQTSIENLTQETKKLATQNNSQSKPLPQTPPLERQATPEKVQSAVPVPPVRPGLRISLESYHVPDSGQVFERVPPANE